MSIILGLDIATSTGYAVLNGKGIREYGIIKLNSKLEYRQRFKQFRIEMIKLIENCNPDIIVIENVYSGPNPKTTAYLNQLRGIIIECLPEKIKLICAPPVLKVRAQVIGTGKGRISKKDVFNWARKKYSKLKVLKFKEHDDITDAVLLAYFAKIS